MKTFLKTYGPAVVSGLLLGVAFPSWNVYPLAWIALVPLFWRAARLDPRAAFGHFLLSGWVFNLFVMQWLMTNVYWAGGWAFCGYVGLCGLLGLFWAVLGFLWCWMGRHVPAGASAMLAAVLWGAMEFLQANLFTGFGWGALAYSQGPDLPVVQWAALGGTTLVSVLLVLVNVLIALAVAEGGRKRVIRAAAAVAVVFAAHGVGYALLGKADYESAPLRVGVVQTDFPLEMKWDGEYTEEMVRNAAEKSLVLAEREQPDLIVWPESTVMDDLDEAPHLREMLAELAQAGDCALYVGAQRNREEGGAFNSSWLVGADGSLVDYYDKVHLAPFGEYVPFSEQLPFVGKIVPAIGDVKRGSEFKTMPLGARRLGPLICFEVLFPEYAERLRGMGADFLVVITNLGWFGASNAIPQERAFGQYRAVETRLPLVHCANTGLSGVFDPFGRFSCVRGGFTASGQFGRFSDSVPERATVMQRAMDAFEVAAPEDRPVPYGPMAFPWLMLGLSCLAVGATAAKARLRG